MSEPHDELLEIADQQKALAAASDAPEIAGPIAAMETAARIAEKASSRSWLGYQAYVYYEGLQPPPAGAHFSSEWGFKNRSRGATTGEWNEYTPDIIESMISDLAGKPDLEPARKLAAEIRQKFEADQSEAISLLSTEVSSSADPYLESLKANLEKLWFHSASDVIENMRPKGRIISRDSLAISQGLRAPPHMNVLASLYVLQQPKILCNELSTIARKAGSHMVRKVSQKRKSETIGTNVFIGHGQSLVWKDMKDFVQDRLNLPWDEFNRVPIAGVTNIARLSEMLDAAAFAFLIMTGEDETAEGGVRARMNVVHEAGLFQGKLGFGRAIILLEEGCEEFSNINGLGQIRFPRGNIKAAFEEIRRVLEREKLIQ